MAARVTSEIFVAALIRTTRNGGGFAYVARKGDAQAGAIFVAFVDRLGGGLELYQAAPPDHSSEAEDRDSRRFALTRTLAGEVELSELVEREARFDPDFWLVEIENWAGPVSELLPIADADDPGSGRSSSSY